MGKTILIVEDEQNIVDILSFNLGREGYDTLEAYDGPTGLQLALENNRIFDLIRLGKVGEVVGEKIPAAKTNFHSFFPIPSEQITLNKALVPSPGYVY